MRTWCGLGVMTLSASLAHGEPSGASRRLDALQLGWMHELSNEDTGEATTISVEVGRLHTPRIGLVGLLRYQKYRYGNDPDESRHDLLVGPRFYVQAVPDRVLLALGAGVLISMGTAIEEPPQGQPFVEAYAGLLAFRLDQDDLEVGVGGGIALDEELGWVGLSLGLRRRSW